MIFQLIFVIGYIGLTIYLANQAQLARNLQEGAYTGSNTETSVRILLYVGVFFMLLVGFNVLFLAMGSEQIVEQGGDVDLPEIDGAVALLTLLATVVMGFAAYRLISSSRTRLWLQNRFGKGHGSYDATSIVHTTAIVLALLLLTGQMYLFVIEGGASGIAESVENEGVAPGDLIFQVVLEVVIAFLGIGWAIRRTLPQALKRLGLRTPTRDDWTWGVGIGIALIGLLFAYSMMINILIELGLVSESEIIQQGEAAESLARAFATLPLAVLLSASAAIGEETFFRGALQPVFGIVPVSAFFALMHSQYLFTPNIVFIFIVSYLLGRLRAQQSTTSAMIAHFLYNLIIQLNVILAVSAEAV